MSKICSFCGSIANDAQVMCNVCGNTLPQTGASAQSKIKYPIYENTDYNAISAREAGYQPQSVQQMSQQRPAPQNKPPQKKKTLPIIIAVVAAVVVVGVALGVIFGIVLPNKEKDKETEKDSASITQTVSDKAEFQPTAKTIAAGMCNVIAVREDGTVVATGKNSYGELNIENWTDIIAISTNINHTVGLKSDGTVIATKFIDDNPGDVNVYNGWSDVESWSNIVAVSAGNLHTVGLKSDGTVVAVGDTSTGACNVKDWTDIVEISAGAYHTVGLKSDGTVVATGDPDIGACDTEDWTDIVAVSAGSVCTVGLKSDGTVVAVGDKSSGACNVEDWRDIAAISCNGEFTVGVKNDGTVIITKRTIYSDVFDKYILEETEKWTEIIAVESYSNGVVGLKSDGTIVVASDIEYKKENNPDEYDFEYDVSGWTDIKTSVPAKFNPPIESDFDSSSSVEVEKETTTKYPVAEIFPTDDEALFSEYLGNMDILDTSGSFLNDTIYDSVFSAKTGDFDDDGDKEMLTFSIVDTDSMVIRLYDVDNGKVVLCDESEPILSLGSGNYDNNICVTLNGNTLLMHSNYCNFGGSSCGERYRMYEISNKQILLLKNYNTYEFYRNNIYEYEESVLGLSFDNIEALKKAAIADGFAPEAHYHSDLYEKTFDEVTLNDNHIFIYRCSYNFSGNYRYVFDNSDI